MVDVAISAAVNLVRVVIAVSQQLADAVEEAKKLGETLPLVQLGLESATGTLSTRARAHALDEVHVHVRARAMKCTYTRAHRRAQRRTCTRSPMAARVYKIGGEAQRARDEQQHADARARSAMRRARGR